MIEPDITIKVGDKVRSYDFPFLENVHNPEPSMPLDEIFSPDPTKYAKDCYIEGVVTRIDFTESVGCDCYHIDVTKDIWKGKEVTSVDKREKVAAPVNGVKSFFGVCNGVVKI